jgi:uncharacterized protein (DUF1501 family)
MNHEEKARRDFLRTATSLALASGLPTLDALSNTALAAGDVGTESIASDYKAIVCVFLYGAQDAANILIPYTDAGGGMTEYTRYATARSNKNAPQDEDSGNLSYPRDRLTNTALPATTVNSISSAVGGGWTTNTHGRSFALPPDYSGLKSLYTAGRLAMVANTGPMLASINRHEWYTGQKARPVNLYSHSDQQGAWMSGLAEDLNPTEGGGSREFEWRESSCIGKRIDHWHNDLFLDTQSIGAALSNRGGARRATSNHNNDTVFRDDTVQYVEHVHEREHRVAVLRLRRPDHGGKPA